VGWRRQRKLKTAKQRAEEQDRAIENPMKNVDRDFVSAFGPEATLEPEARRLSKERRVLQAKAVRRTPKRAQAAPAPAPMPSTRLNSAHNFAVQKLLSVPKPNRTPAGETDMKGRVGSRHADAGVRGPTRPSAIPKKVVHHLPEEDMKPGTLTATVPNVGNPRLLVESQRERTKPVFDGPGPESRTRTTAVASNPPKPHRELLLNKQREMHGPVDPRGVKASARLWSMQIARGAPPPPPSTSTRQNQGVSTDHAPVIGGGGAVSFNVDGRHTGGAALPQSTGEQGRTSGVQRDQPDAGGGVAALAVKKGGRLTEGETLPQSLGEMGRTGGIQRDQPDARGLHVQGVSGTGATGQREAKLLPPKVPEEIIRAVFDPTRASRNATFKVTGSRDARLETRGATLHEAFRVVKNLSSVEGRGGMLLGSSSRANPGRAPITGTPLEVAAAVMRRYIEAPVVKDAAKAATAAAGFSASMAKSTAGKFSGREFHEERENDRKMITMIPSDLVGTMRVKASSEMNGAFQSTTPAEERQSLRGLGRSMGGALIGGGAGGRAVRVSDRGGVVRENEELHEGAAADRSMGAARMVRGIKTMREVSGVDNRDVREDRSTEVPSTKVKRAGGSARSALFSFARNHTPNPSLSTFTEHDARRTTALSLGGGNGGARRAMQIAKMASLSQQREGDDARGPPGGERKAVIRPLAKRTSRPAPSREEVEPGFEDASWLQ
jgi:hypothetical protein